MKFKSVTHEFVTCLACAVNLIFPKGKKRQTNVFAPDTKIWLRKSEIYIKTPT